MENDIRQSAAGPSNHDDDSRKTSNELVAMDIAETPRVRTKFGMVAILVALYLSLFIVALDQTIVATAIPTITSQLHSSSGYFWVGGAYLLADAAAGPIWAKCSDIWGRKPALLSAVTIFAGASILAALSSSMRMLIAARALQGTAGGGLIQLVYITVSDLFSMRRRSLILGFVEVVWGLAGGAGPLIGGALTQLVSWRWCFWVNVPVCGLALILLTFFLDVHNPRTRFQDGIKAIDWLGTLTMLGVTLMLLLGLDFGGSIFPWSSPKVICLIIFGALMIGVFLFSEKKLAKYPLIPLEMFKNPANIAACAVCFCHGMVFIASVYYLPLYFQSAKQKSPLHSGILILPLTITEGSMGIVAGLAIHATGRYREIVWIGIFMLTMGTGVYINFGTNTPVAEIIGIEIIAGIGSGLLFEAPLIAVQNTVHQNQCASATATIGFVRSISTAVSVVLGGVIFQNSMNAKLPLLRSLGVGESIIDVLVDGKAAANVEVIATIQDVQLANAVKDAFSSSIRNMWIVYTCIAGVGLIAGIFIKQAHLSREHTETRTGIDEMKERPW
ncbi:Hypothetical protein R9X50_00363400 [Acrodontium crateriforme]|uniref:Major facilitator superfamily (MFS) profile domain-containing protein n=1 Tax=Acrodontium crateriforme TaxID=150365 RepID=A0AAQ3M3T3_9PEZI|nr:Hypothetical protein R9X50_00363400 [Acrodontium crateriforme]